MIGKFIEYYTKIKFGVNNCYSLLFQIIKMTSISYADIGQIHSSLKTDKFSRVTVDTLADAICSTRRGHIYKIFESSSGLDELFLHYA